MKVLLCFVDTSVMVLTSVYSIPNPTTTSTLYKNFPPKFLAKPLPEWPQIGRQLVDNTKILKIARSIVS